MLGREHPELHVPHVFRKTVNYNDSGIGSGVKFGTLPAGAQLLPSIVNVRTVFNAGTTNVLTVGTNASSYNNIVAAGDVNEASATPQAVPTANLAYQASEVDVYAMYTESGTAATTGIATIGLLYMIDNDL